MPIDFKYGFHCEVGKKEAAQVSPSLLFPQREAEIVAMFSGGSLHKDLRFQFPTDDPCPKTLEKTSFLETPAWGKECLDVAPHLYVSLRSQLFHKIPRIQFQG